MSHTAGALADKVVIVTGASRGVGAALAVALAEQGAWVACVARATDAAPLALPGTVDETARQANEAGAASGGRAVAVPADLSDPEQTEALVDTVVEHFGGIDALVNNAAVTFVGDLDLPPKRYDLVFAINLAAPMALTRLCRPHMAARGGGHIVNVSSQAGLSYYPTMLVYGMSKAALEHLTMGSAALLADDNIAANCFRIDTPVASEGFMMNAPEADHDSWADPRVAANGIIWMLSQPTGDYTGRLESMVALANRTGCMPEIADKQPPSASRWSTDRGRGIA